MLATRMELKAGSPIAAIPHAPVTAEQLRAYAEASGDPNPIHLDEEAAKKVGLPGIIAHGMLIAGLIAERANRFMEGDVGGSWTMTRFQTRFRAMTFLGDVISIGGSIKSSSDDEIVLDLQATNQRGETATTGVVCFRRG